MFHVKVFYPSTFRDGRVIGCILLSTPLEYVAQRVCQKLRRARFLGYASGDGMHFVHQEREVDDCPLCPQWDRHTIGCDFLGNACVINGVRCCAVCYTLHCFAEQSMGAG